MDSIELRALFDQQVRFGAEDPLSERHAVPPDAPIVVRIVPVDGNARWGWVIWSRLDETDADEAIREQVAFFTGHGQDFEWKLFGHDRPADLGERLLEHGFVREDHETVMALDLVHGLPPAQEHDIRKVTEHADLCEVARLEEAIWGDPHDWIVSELGAELLLPGEPTVMYLAYVDGVPAAAAWMRFYEGTDFAALFGGSTLPEHRKKGLYSALLHVRAVEAARRGYRFLSVDASEMSRPILEKHGFVEITTATAYKYYVKKGAE